MSIDVRGQVPIDTFAARLAIVRIHAGGYNIRRAALKAGISPESWRRYEAGHRPSDLVDIVQRIVETFGVDRDWLLWGGPLTPANLRGGASMGALFRENRRERRRRTDYAPSAPVDPPLRPLIFIPAPRGHRSADAWRAVRVPVDR